MDFERLINELAELKDDKRTHIYGLKYTVEEKNNKYNAKWFPITDLEDYNPINYNDGCEDVSIFAPLEKIKCFVDENGVRHICILD